MNKIIRYSGGKTMIRFIASDIDGTLVADGNTNINPEIFTLIRELKKMGIHFTAASGRQYGSVSKLFSPVKDDIFFVVENGGLIRTSSKKIASTSMKKEYVRQIIEEARQIPNCELLLCLEDISLVESKDQNYIDFLRYGYNNDIEVVKDLLAVDQPILKVSLYNENDIETCAGHMIESWNHTLKATLAGKQWIDFMNPAVNKGAGLKELQQYLNVKTEETMVFGDQLNDIEMMHQAKYSFAVESAREETKRAASEICGSYKNDGVIKVLRKLVEQGGVWE